MILLFCPFLTSICVDQQGRVHLHSNAQHIEPTHAQCPACQKLLASFPCSLQCPRSWALSLCCCSILYCFYAESTLLFYHVVFLPFCPHQWVRSLEVQPSIFVFWGDEYTSDSLPWFNLSLWEFFGMLNMLSHCWGHSNTPLDNTSTNTQHVESLYSGQIQCICTRLDIHIGSFTSIKRHVHELYTPIKHSSLIFFI